MASSIRVLENERATEVTSEAKPATPQAVTELPVVEPFDGRNRRFIPRVESGFIAATTAGDLLQGIDISFGGMLCSSETPVWPGNELSAELHLCGGEEPVPVRGRVVELVSHRGKIAMRVRFLDVEDNARRCIATFMARAVGHCR
ncbi:MAG: PilZ domain-containing protein [Myxococcota bacterium]